MPFMKLSLRGMTLGWESPLGAKQDSGTQWVLLQGPSEPRAGLKRRLKEEDEEVSHQATAARPPTCRSHDNKAFHDNTCCTLVF